MVTENFEQVLHLARSQTPGPLAGWITMDKPEPLADLELTLGYRNESTHKVKSFSHSIKIVPARWQMI
ncbi:MAG: hypothetical protein Ct9H300mP14_02850 [Gammaproteobacteria bacterium]|nr:MAG: hypothetical protein Ct9H300mP14_02850 [Gammaproteobacteria bacterium]